MKPIDIFVLFAVVAACSAGLVKQNAIPWDEIDANVNEIETIVEANFVYMVEESTRGNPTIGAEIAAYIETQLPALENIFLEIESEVELKTLTVESSEAYVAELDELVVKIIMDLEDEINQLPQENKQNILNRFAQDFIRIHEIADEIIVLLQQ